ncbi:patatin-like phospholipase family protein [Aquabacterium sp. A7-Y]|uniref:patatin-like phospholipase family protein n=1 Tax=Aquabacterium sp. A7-Y TaxID=1349605 RepID=UPI00223E4FE5|nr:patatin-like phospholipase family protein [Aquabacterium sp. A7-Y]MCW7541736.1 patatin-like phospholipase family protein [Aquabacterium sp. A7-Y]
MSSRFTTLKAFAAGLLLAGCASAPERPTANAQGAQLAAAESRELYAQAQQQLAQRLVRRVQARGDHTLDILLLSGGGQNGAYGAGFLRGWQAHPGAPMPRFDLVTGVSTGALQTPFALLGSEAALAQASRLYREAAERIAPGFDWWFWLNRKGGLLDTSRYRRALDEAVSPVLVEALAKEFAAGRDIAIATSDFDLGTGRIWSLADTLARPDGLERARSLFMASSAIPGAFPPVMLDGRVHADGGIVSNLLIAPDREGYRRLAEALPAAGVHGPVTVRLWVVMNLWTHARPMAVDAGSVLSMSRRSALMLFWSQQPQLLQGLHDMARLVGSDHPQLKLQVRFTAIPSELAGDPAAEKLFDKDWMARMEALGHARAQSASPWDALTTIYARPPAATSAEPGAATY